MLTSARGTQGRMLGKRSRLEDAKHVTRILVGTQEYNLQSARSPARCDIYSTLDCVSVQRRSSIKRRLT